LVPLDLLVLLDDVLIVLLLGDLGLALVATVLFEHGLDALQPFDRALVVVAQLRVLLPQPVHLLVARLQLVLRLAAVKQGLRLGNVQCLVMLLLLIIGRLP
jgi:hypothetical protein